MGWTGRYARAAATAALLAVAACGDDGGSLPDGGGVDGDVSPDANGDAGGSGLPCERHHDCLQGEFCHRGSCRLDEVPVHHCGKAGCPPGRWCVDESGARATCAEDPDYVCATPCDCGPAHCCVGSRCVRDDGDPWLGTAPGSTSACWGGPGIPEEERTPTYCATDPECFAGARAWTGSARSGTFRAFDPRTGEIVRGCGGTTCYGTACSCDTGESCVDTIHPTVPPGTACGLLSGGTCVSHALAESVFSWPPAELLSCCGAGSRPGERCELGWIRSGNRYAYERIVATAAEPGSCACGDGACCPDELAACPADCLPHGCDASLTCGPIAPDGRCDALEYATASAAPDCTASCGDGVCTEDPATCPADCGERCGDRWCSPREASGGADACPEDCADRCPDTASYSRRHSVCGDGVCRQESICDWLEAESCRTCPADCGECGWELMRDPVVLGHVEGVLHSVWVGGEREVFIGSDNGRIYRYDGSSWTTFQLAPPSGSALTQVTSDIWGSPGGQVYAANLGRIFRYDGATWTEMLLPDGASPARVWGTGDSDVFAVDSDQILHYDGSRWSAEALPAPDLVGGLLGGWKDVWGDGAGTVYAVGTQRDSRRHTTVVLRRRGTTWEVQASIGGVDLNRLWGSGPDDVFAGGYDGALYHFDGVAWTAMVSGTSHEIRGLFGTGATNVFAVTYGGEILAYDGRTWTTAVPALMRPFHAIGGSGPGIVYAVGGDIFSHLAALWRHDGVGWAPMETQRQPDTFTGAWGGDDGALFVVGRGGLIARVDGSRYERMESGTDEDMRAIWGLSPGAIFAMSEGAIHRYDGTVWSRFYDPLPGSDAESFADIAGAGGSDIFVAAEGATIGALHHWNGSEWRTGDAGLGSGAVATAVWANAPADVFVAGQSALGMDVAHFDGTAWTALASGVDRTSGPIGHLWGAAPGTVLGLQPNAALEFPTEPRGWLHRYDGSTWGVVRLRDWVDVLAARSPGEVYLGDHSGSLFRLEGATLDTVMADVRNASSAECPSVTAFGLLGDSLVAVGTGELILRQVAP